MATATAQPAFPDVVRDVTPALLRYLERYVGNHGVAEELCQETLLRMSAGYGAFAGRSSVKTWAFSIASRVAADHFRGAERRTRIVDVDDVAEPADPGRSVDERIAIDEMNQCVRRLIDSLPEIYRSALILHDIEGLSPAQTAEASECSLASAKIRIHRARVRLKEALATQCDFYRDGESVLRCDQRSRGDEDPRTVTP